ncbi:MAG TPA: hypothetical protein VGG14_15865 [Candidatus Sulfotelmatobacter sp.]|jgi:hypothetical protein
MKLAGMISTAVLTLSLGIGIPAYAQQDQHDQQEENKAKPAQDKEDKAQPQKTARPEERNAPPEKNAREEKSAQEQHTQEANPGKRDEHARGNGRIPDDRFKANFGREHSFRVSEGDYRNHRFQYGGYWFGFASVWPSNWLYTQDVYVIEIDGVYYLCNANYPGVNLTLSLTL